MNKKHQQSGMFLLEALIAILIFSLGILGMVAMGGTAIAAQSDAQYRNEAANFANEIASKIALNVDRSDIPTSLQAYAHQPVDAGYCNFAGAASGDPTVLNWVDEVRGAVPGTLGLPGATNVSQQIAIGDPVTTFNRVTITVCWQPPSTSATPLQPWHRHILVTYIN